MKIHYWNFLLNLIFLEHIVKKVIAFAIDALGQFSALQRYLEHLDVLLHCNYHLK